jgi:hypothetical protein
VALVACHVFGQLLAKKNTRASFDAKIARFRAGPGTMMIHLALAGLPDGTAGTELKRFAYVHLAPSLEAMTATYTQAISGLLAGRAGPGRRTADRDRSLARAGRPTRPLGAGAGVAGDHPRGCGRHHYGDTLGRCKGDLLGAGDRVDRALRA